MQPKTKLNLQMGNIHIAIAHAELVYAPCLYKSFELNCVIRQFGKGVENFPQPIKDKGKDTEGKPKENTCGNISTTEGNKGQSRDKVAKNAKERMTSGINQHSPKETFPDPKDTGQTRDKVAEKARRNQPQSQNVENSPPIENKGQS